MASNGDYCSFLKAVEHLGDRWSLVIIRDLQRFGTRGFNALADGLPGVSRSVLAARLRKLEELGLITRDLASGRGVPGYCLTAAGRELEPVLEGLWHWSERWVPEDPAMAQRDPSILPVWLSRRIDRTVLPERRAVIELNIRDAPAGHGWLVVERGSKPSICIEDPGLAEDRYVYVEADANALFPLARGLRGWPEAIADGSVLLFGDPELVRALPMWFGGAEETGSPNRQAAVSVA
jgi:DNA-binding HxlR family transcriptional regulator